MRKLPSRKLLGAIIAGVLLLPETAFTLGLGEIEVNSALNQKLKADIELLSATPEDTENLIVKLASRKEFTRAGLDRPYLLNDLRFKSVVVDGVPQIKVSSGGPIREPFLNFLVEIDWPNGHLIREYTVLLDPPVFMTQPASVAPAPAKQNDDFRPSSTGSSNVVPVVTPGVSLSARPGAAAAAPVSQPAARSTDAVSNTPAFVPAPYVQQLAVVNQQPGAYRIKNGDTAWSLADAMRPDQSITVEQMMVAMLRANPESFIDENVNGLKRGYILRVPDYDQIVAVNQADARALVREQAALWRQYQQTHAGGQPASAMPGEGVTGASGGGATAESENDAYLEIVSAGSGASTTGAKDPTKMSAQELRAELALARERVETERVEKEALQRRIEALEQNVGKMKGMLSIEDDALSDVQALGESIEGEPSEAEALEADIVADAKAEMEESIAETEDMLAEQHLEDAIVEESLTEKAGEASEADATEEAAVFLDETVAEDETADVAEEAPAAGEAANDAVAPQPQFVPKPQPDPLTKLLSDPILLAAAGGGLLLILAVIALIIKRRKAAAAEEEVAAPASSDADDDLESLADEIAGETAGDETVAESLTGDADLDRADENLDPDSTMILDAAEDTLVVEENLEAAAEEGEPRDDVIAEADVYLAYGIYQQAEELLTQAIADNPERDDYRVKLAETHYASKNTDAFIDVATDIKKRAGDEITPSWKKVMVMGQDMCADNALFQGSMVGGLDVDSLAPKAPEMDFDLGLDAGDEAAPDLDLSLDDEPLELPEMDELEPVADKAESAKTDEEEADDDETLVAPAGELEFDLSDTGAVEEAPAEEDEFSLDIDASELDIDIQEEVEEEVIDLTDELQDVGDIDIDFGLDEETPATDEAADESTAEADADEATAEDDVVVEAAVEEESVEEEIEIDLTEEAEAMDLDLGVDADSEATSDAEAEEEIISAPAAGDDFADDEDDFDLSSLDDVDEVSTKLDLARAYLDMGDHEGTRGILEEVIAEGNDEQKKEAGELMAQLDS